MFISDGWVDVGAKAEMTPTREELGVNPASVGLNLSAYNCSLAPFVIPYDHALLPRKERC